MTSFIRPITLALSPITQIFDHPHNLKALSSGLEIISAADITTSRAGEPGLLKLPIKNAAAASFTSDDAEGSAGDPGEDGPEVSALNGD